MVQQNDSLVDGSRCPSSSGPARWRASPAGETGSASRHTRTAMSSEAEASNPTSPGSQASALICRCPHWPHYTRANKVVAIHGNNLRHRDEGRMEGEPAADRGCVAGDCLQSVADSATGGSAPAPAGPGQGPQRHRALPRARNPCVGSS